MEDLLYKYLSIFQNLPRVVKKIVGHIYGLLPKRIKYGSFYFTYLSRLRSFREMNDKEVSKAQEMLLFETVNFAIAHIPYYKGFRICNSMEEFRELPVINKQVIRNSPLEFVNPVGVHHRIRSNTGGSSGTPLEFYLEKNVSRPKERAHFDWYWGQFGYKHGDKILMIRGLPIQNNKLYEYRPIDNVLNVTCYNINENNLSLILDNINRFEPMVIHAYPSSLKILTVLMDGMSYKNRLKVKSIFLGSEYLTTADRIYFESFYSAPVVNWYGHTERLIHGGNCPYSDEFHFYPFYGYLELLDEQGVPVIRPGSEGRIVATGFDNRIMPFIRYDTGDRGVLSGKTNCSCGFKGITLKMITGRSQHVIVLNDNTRVSLTAFIFGQHLEAFKKIQEMQILQEKKGEIELKIIKSSAYTDVDERDFLKTLLESVNHKIRISVTYVNHLDKTSSGKNILFISKLSE